MKIPGTSLPQERRLPENLDPIDNKLDDPMTRERLARVFERGLGTPVGFVLPVQRWQAAHDRRRWMTEAWSTRSKRLFVVPGESPVGYRLPLPSLPHVRRRSYPTIIPIGSRSRTAEQLAEPDPHRQPFLARRLDARTRSRARSFRRKPTGPSKGSRRCALRSSSSRATDA